VWTAPPLARVFWKLLHSAGWCGHVSGLFMRPFHVPLAIMPFASRVPIDSTHLKCFGLVGFPEPAVSTGFVHSLLSALPNFRGALQLRQFLRGLRPCSGRFAIAFAACHERPDDARHFVGQRNRRDLR